MARGSQRGFRTTAGLVIIARGLGLTMRLFAHLVARLAIAATCTNSAAALDANIERGNHPSSASNLWENLMSNSLESMNQATGRDGVSIRELRVDRRDKGGRERCGIVYVESARAPRSDETEPDSLPAVVASTTRADAPWSSVFAFFLEGFALYAASYCGFPHVIAAASVEPRAADAEAGQAERPSVRDRRRSIALVYSSTSRE
jgi:hypothetical protein